VNATPGQAFSTTVAKDAVADTNPKIGSPVAKGGLVQLLISQGPQPFTLPTLVGQTEKDALDLIGTHWKAGTTARPFDSKIPAGVVMDALDAQSKSLQGVAQYGEGQTISLVVSAGPLPGDLAGKSVADATTELAAAPYKLTVTGNVDVFSQTVAKGAVVGVVTTDASGGALVIHVGDKVQLQTSKGPEQVPVPNVVGVVWATAQKTLTDAGFKIEFAGGVSKGLASGFPNAAVVKSIKPGVGQVVDKGSTVTVELKIN
jgi:eukaryotic-like serine/threonine-protein kinase